jgi:hypothetical protein
MELFRTDITTFSDRENTSPENCSKSLFGPTLSQTVKAALLDCVSPFALGFFGLSDCLLVELGLRRSGV